MREDDSGIRRNSIKNFTLLDITCQLEQTLCHLPNRANVKLFKDSCADWDSVGDWFLQKYILKP